MQNQYTREELWKLYRKLPEELQEAIFSAETTGHIGTVCERNNVHAELIPRVASQVGNVLMGLTLPDEFQKVLERDVGLKKPIAQQVNREVTRFIFYPVKPALEQLHQINIGKQGGEQTAKPAGPTVQEAPPSMTEPAEQPSKADEKVFSEEFEQEQKKDDAYREPSE